MISRRRILLEVLIKHLLTVFLFGGIYLPIGLHTMPTMPSAVQESVIGLLGFLMAAAIIGAFELSYSRTNLTDSWQRYLAHFTKLTLYSSILLLGAISIVAMAVTPGPFIDALIMAAIPIFTALFAYDIWDVLRALDQAKRDSPSR